MASQSFREVHCTRHIGLPIKNACILLAISAALCNAYSLYFLPDIPRYILMTFAVLVAAIGCSAVLLEKRICTSLYLIFEILVRIPVCVVIGFLINALVNYGGKCDAFGGFVICDGHSKYEKWLMSLGLGFLWSALLVASVSCLISLLSLGGFRKLRSCLAGVRSFTVTEHHFEPHEGEPQGEFNDSISRSTIRIDREISFSTKIQYIPPSPTTKAEVELPTV